MYASSPSYYNPSSSGNNGNFDWGSALPGIAGGIGSLIGGFNSGSGQMQDQINNAINRTGQTTDQANQYLQPYQQGGQQAYGQYNDWLQRMQNPTGFYNDVMSQYQMSPAAQFQMEQGTQAANHSAAAAGNVGTPAAQKALMRYSQGLSSQDMQNYFNNVMGVNSQYGGGLNNLNQMGYGAANQMGQNLMMSNSQIAQLLQNMGMAGAYGQQQQGAGIGGAIGGIAGGLLSGGLF